MSYTIYHNEQANQIEVLHLGTLTFQELEQCLPATANQCKRHHCWHVFFDFRQSKYQLSAGDEFTFIQALSEQFEPESTIELLIADEQIPYEQIRLLQQNARIYELELTIRSLA